MLRTKILYYYAIYLSKFSPIIILFLISVPKLSAQIIEGDLKMDTPRQSHILLFRIDKRLEGRIFKMDEEIIYFVDDEGLISQIEREEILKIIIKKKSLFNIPKKEIVSHATMTNIGFSPTAFNFQQGEEKYTNYLFLHNFYTIGVSDNVSVTGGFTIAPFRRTILF